jgi:hypothetical protein
MTQTGAGAIGSPTPPIEVTGTSAGVALNPPATGGYRYAIVSNVTPWIATFIGAGIGGQTLQPYTADILAINAGQSLSASMSVPPGVSATAAGGAATYLQADWFDTLPSGTYPLSLTSQAITAAISGVTIGSTQLVYSGTIAALTGTFPAVALQPGARALLIVLDIGAQLTDLVIVGAATGTFYLFASPGFALSNESPYWIGFDSTNDPQLTFASAAGVGSLKIWAISDVMAPGFAGLVGSIINVGGSAGPGQSTALVGGADLAGTVHLANLTVPGSAVAGAPILAVGGTDGTNAQAFSILPPGAAQPSEILATMPGLDGMGNERQLSTDTSGRLILPRQRIQHR